MERWKKFVLGGRPIFHCLNFAGVHRDASCRQDEPKKRHSRGMILTLFSLHIQLVLQETLEDCSYMLDMFILKSGENQNAIKIYEHKSDQHISQNIIDITDIIEVLEYGWCIGQGMTRYSWCPVGVLNAVFHLSPSLMWTRG